MIEVIRDEGAELEAVANQELAWKLKSAAMSQVSGDDNH